MRASLACPDLLSLELLRTTIEMGSISAAAKEFTLSQPSASERLSLLERKLGLPLLRRGRSGSEPEPGALVLLDDIERLLEAATLLVEHARSLTQADDATLSLGASFTIAEYFLPDYVPNWCAGASGRSVKMLIRNSFGIEAAVRDGSVQMGLVEGPSVDPNVEATTIAEDHLVLVVAPQHPWAALRMPISPGLLVDGVLIAREAGSGTRAVFEDALVAAGQPVPSYASELGSTTAVKSAVMAGTHGAVISARAVADEIARGALVEIPVALDLRRSFSAIWARSKRLSPPCRSFLDLIRETT